ncbi:CPBP family intramembrane glutamic endopeptidase [Millisia brevis]|uniref:CPBP family intramembrane glutamic endopeptidase n=1 Tax=Millisia brevis TaxID=264148 RepID=UPI000A05FCF8|nr:type II CAAX endopeptidase family protein [Millisia brevis]
MANDPQNIEPSAYPPSQPFPSQPPRTGVHYGPPAGWASGGHPPPSAAPAPVTLPAGVEYHRVYAARKPGIGRGIAALVLLFAGMLIIGMIIGIGGAGIDAVLGNDSVLLGGAGYTPALHAASLLGIAVILPWAMVIQLWLYRVPAASLHSVLSVFRWEIFGRCLAVVVPLWTVGLAVVTALTPTDSIPWSVADLIALFVVTVLLTPLQAAAEEYGFRGLAFRVGGGWGRTPAVGLVIGVLLSSVLFTVSHLALDPWLNLYYFIFGATLCLITWRSGGLEIAVVIHAVNNTLAFLLALVLWADFAAGWDRSVGTGSPLVLVLCALLIGVCAIVWRITRRSGPGRTPVPAG